TGAITVGGAGFLTEIGDGLSTHWSHRYPGLTFTNLTPDGTGGYLATGSYQGTFAPGGGAKPNPDHEAGFLADFSGGEGPWSRTLGGDVDTTATSVVALDDGRLVVGGLTAGGELISEEPATEGIGFMSTWQANEMTASSVLGWGTFSPDMTVDGSGDVVT